MEDVRKQKISRWYFGGLASSGAACFTHPLDLIKVMLQTQQEKNVSILQLTAKVVKNQGTFLNLKFNIYNMIFKLVP